MTAGDRALAFELYRYLVGTQDDNVFLSPYSISTAMSMVLAGARGQTADELANALGVGDMGPDWHLARNSLDLELAALARYDPPSYDPDAVAVPLTLEPTNTIFGQAGYPFKPDFLDVLASDYGAGMNAVDFATQTERARQAINAWVADRTRGRIPELLPQGSIDNLTRAVLVNAIYFKANWVRQFNPQRTLTAPFHLLDGSTVDVSMMTGSGSGYASGDGWQAAQLDYDGGPTMTVIVPDEGHFADVEGELKSDFIATLDSNLQRDGVDVQLPKWATDTRFDVIPALQGLGVDQLFDPQNADLTGIADVVGERLFVSAVIHQANITIDEHGTEAAAATAVGISVVSGHLSQPSLTVDRPFIYMIRGGQNNEILFMGRVLRP